MNNYSRPDHILGARFIEGSSLTQVLDDTLLVSPAAQAPYQSVLRPAKRFSALFGTGQGGSQCSYSAITIYNKAHGTGTSLCCPAWPFAVRSFLIIRLYRHYNHNKGQVFEYLNESSAVVIIASEHLSGMDVVFLSAAQSIFSLERYILSEDVGLILI